MNPADNPIEITARAIVERVGADAAAWAQKRFGPPNPITGMHVTTIVAYVDFCELGSDLRLASIEAAYNELARSSAPQLETLSSMFTSKP
jgi:hypothetical protein